MEVIYALEEIPETINKSIFLAGPTPRGPDGIAWRQEALKILELKGYDGTVFVPEPRDAKWHREYDRQVEWEDLCLNTSDCILFWIPRNLKTMPGFTTNIEWGRWENSGKVVLGYPEEAEKMSYTAFYAKKEGIPTVSGEIGTLEHTIEMALVMTNFGADRSKGERNVPLHIWWTPQFQSWYKSQTDVGNYLNSSKVLFTYNHRWSKGVFLFVLRANVYVAHEDRIKEHDFVLSRTDVSSVMLWKPASPVEESEIVFVREYRPAISNHLGFVVELASGSSSDPGEIDPLTLAIEEVREETGFHVEPERLKSHGARQLASTLSSHKSHLFSVELTDDEMDYFKSQVGHTHGMVHEGERTYIEIFKLKDIFVKDVLDWGALGQIYAVVNSL